MIAVYVLSGALVLLALAGVLSHRQLLRQRTLVEESWRQVDVALTCRHNLIPDLLETVRSYAAQEGPALTDVAEARDVAIAASGVTAKGEAETFLRRSLQGLLAVAEAYPDLKAAGLFGQLRSQLTEIENRISASRRDYNNAVRALQSRVEAFPGSVLASAFHVEKAAFFETLDPQTRDPIEADGSL